jgi:hypothetical protein
MEIIYTPKFIKLFKKIRDKRSKEDTDKVLSKLKIADDFSEVNNILDIKKYSVISGYRIRYSYKPEMRIRFSLETSPIDETREILKLTWIGTRADYDKTLGESINESFVKKQIFIISESQYQKLVMELSPKSNGVKEFIEYVKETPGLLKHLNFRTYKSLEEYILDGSYEDFDELKKDAKEFKPKDR